MEFEGQHIDNKGFSFRNRGKLHWTEEWVYNTDVLDNIDEFNYLGMMLNLTVIFLIHKNMQQNRTEKLYFH